MRAIYNGATVGEAETTIVISDTEQVDSHITCMMIGDSMLAEEELVPLLSGNLTEVSIDAQFMGTQGEDPYNHEGRGGWTVAKYLSDGESPFVFDGEYNFSEYMKQQDIQSVDYIFIVLGINDFLSLDFAINDSELEGTIEETLKNYHTLIDGIKE